MDCSLHTKCRLTLAELAGKIDYRSVGAAVQRFEQRCHRDPGLARLLARAEKVLKNAEM
jgi:hypothetical protein